MDAPLTAPARPAYIVRRCRCGPAKRETVTLMSRGLGRLQRAILAALAAEPGLTSFDLAAQVYRVPVRADGRWSVGNAQRAAVRRALSSL